MSHAYCPPNPGVRIASPQPCHIIALNLGFMAQTHQQCMSFCLKWHVAPTVHSCTVIGSVNKSRIHVQPAVHRHRISVMSSMLSLYTQNLQQFLIGLPCQAYFCLKPTSLQNGNELCSNPIILIISDHLKRKCSWCTISLNGKLDEQCDMSFQSIAMAPC